MSSATATKRNIRRNERLPSGWKWLNNMAVVNAEDPTDIVYLTSGLTDEKRIAQAIQQVVQDRATAKVRQKNSYS